MAAAGNLAPCHSENRPFATPDKRIVRGSPPKTFLNQGCSLKSPELMPIIMCPFWG